MKPRRVILTLEVQTDAPLDWLRRSCEYTVTIGDPDAGYDAEVLQAQANVVKEER